MDTRLSSDNLLQLLLYSFSISGSFRFVFFIASLTVYVHVRVTAYQRNPKEFLTPDQSLLVRLSNSLNHIAMLIKSDKKQTKCNFPMTCM